MNKKIIIPVIALFIVLAGGILTWQFWPREVETPEEIKTPEKVKDVIDETADWEIYTNTQLNYSISYPSDAIINTSNPNCVSIKKGTGYIFIGSEPTFEYPCGIMTGGFGVTTISVYEHINIDGQKYLAHGFVDYITNTGSFSFHFTDKIVVTYEVREGFPLPLEDRQQQNHRTMDSMEQILSTLKSPLAPTAQLKITSPAEGKKLTEGQTYSINWTGGMAEYNISLECIPSVGDELSVGSAKAIDGVFQWTLRDFTDITSSAKCRLIFRYQSPSFESIQFTVARSDYFTIIASPAVNF